MTVLMRVDTQLDDKDLREKMRMCADYTPIDFGVEFDFAMMAPSKRPLPDTSINASGINVSGMKLVMSEDQPP